MSKNGLYLRDEADVSEEEILWDEEFLEMAYEEAIGGSKDKLKNVHKARKVVKEENTLKSMLQSTWSVGSKCQVVWRVDGLVYDAEVTEIELELGRCRVRYTNFGDEEEQMVSALLPPGTVPTGGGGDYGLRTEDEENVDDSIPPLLPTTDGRQIHAIKHEPKSQSDRHSTFTLPQPPPLHFSLEDEDDPEGLHSLLLSWYMCGYHTGYYQGMKAAKSSR